jgi:hypothetical protein
MSIVISVAGLVWLALALFNVRKGGSFNWSIVVVFLVLLAGFSLAGAQGRKHR